METILITSEKEIKQWLREVLEEHFVPGAVPYKQIVAEQFLNSAEAAEFLNVSIVTLLNWRKRGLPFYKEKRRVMFLQSEIVAYIKENKLR
ncbi:MAG: helix-turn-helix domain-containing protein [Ferruginibacter sp.]